MFGGASRGRVFAFALALGLGSVALGVVLLPGEAAGQKPSPARDAPGQPDAGERHDPESRAALSAFMEALARGTEKYAARDYPGAIDVYKKAIQLDPRHPLGPYLLGEAYLANDNLGEAEAAFKAAEEKSDPKLQRVRSRVLFAVADVYERQKEWEQARAAWQLYTQHAATLGVDGGAHPQSGAARIKAIDDASRLDKQYEVVRQRIAAERSDAGAPSAAKK